MEHLRILSGKCFDATYTEATKDLFGFLYIDVVLNEPWMQFCKGFNDLLVVEGNTLRNVKTNRLKQKQSHDAEQKEECCNDDVKDPQCLTKKANI